MRLRPALLPLALAGCIVTPPSTDGGAYCYFDGGVALPAGCAGSGATGSAGTTGGPSGGSSGAVTSGGSTGSTTGGSTGSTAGGSTGSTAGGGGGNCPSLPYDPTSNDLFCGGASFSDGGCDPGTVCAPGKVCLASRCTRPAPMILPVLAAAAAVDPASGSIYAAGGLFLGVTLPFLQIYRPRLNRWTVTPMPSARSLLGAAWGGDGRLHTVGGAGVGPNCDLNTLLCKTNEGYDPVTGLWSDDTALPYALLGPAAVTDPDGGIDVLGGSDILPLAGAGDELLAGDATPLATWNTLQPMISKREEFAAGFTSGSDLLYAAGGFDGTRDLASAEVYDRATNQWSALTGMLQALRFAAGAAGTATFTVVGGATSPGGTGPIYTAVRDVMGYSCPDGGACRWHPGLPLVQGRGGHAAVWSGSRLYVLGGAPAYDTTLPSHKVFSALPTVEVWDPRQPDGGWVSSICPSTLMAFALSDAGAATAAGTVGTTLAAGNLNGDGYPDVVAGAGAPDGGWMASSFLNDGTGGLNAGSVLGPQPGGVPRGMALADFGNGMPDLAVTTDGQELAVALGSGAGAFGPPASYASMDAGPSPDGGPDLRALAVSDFNHDGKPDLAVASSREGWIGIFLDEAGAGFSGFAASGFTTCPSPLQLVAADFDADGAPDLAVLCNDGTILLYLGNGKGSFTATSQTFDAANGVSLAVTDFNLDGLPDLVVGSSLQAASGTLDVEVLVNQGGSPPSFLAKATGSVPAPDGGGENDLHVTIGDFNADGYPDVVTSEAGGQNSYVFLNDGSGSGLILAGTYPTTGATPRAAVTADLRLDGWTDFVRLDSSTRALEVWLNGCLP